MKSIFTAFITLFVMMISVEQIVAQVDLKTVLPAYPGAQISTMGSGDDEQIAVTTRDDAKAVMIFYKKMLVYDGWQVLSGKVLEYDPIVFTRDGLRLSMIADITGQNLSRIVFTISD